MKKDLIFGSILLTLLGCILIISALFNNNKLKEYSEDFYYMDTLINVKVYLKNSNEKEKVFSDINSIYKEYHELTDRYNSYNGINNVYYINNNKSKDEYINISTRLYDILKYSLEMKEKTNNLFDINIGCKVDIWKKYKENQNGVPSLEELNCVSNDIVLTDNNILNNHPYIDLGGIAKGYVTGIVKEYLETNNIKHYLINAGGNVVVGGSYFKPYYKIGIENPDGNGLLKILKVTNKAIITSGSKERFYEYDGIKYSHIINPITGYPSDEFKSVTIICNDSKLGDVLSTVLTLTSVEDGKKIINDLKEDIEVVWYTKDDKIIITNGVSNYE